MPQDLRPGVGVVTQLRRPASRIVSMYEFAVGVAAEGLGEHGEPGPAPEPTDHPNYVSTLHVWPWSILVPWFQADMRARVRGRGTIHRGVRGR